MVLESLLNPLNAEKKPWEMFFIGFFYSSIAILLSLWIFPDQASLVMVFFTVLACVPIVYNTMKFEEKKDLSIQKESSLLKEHNKAIIFLMFLFFGMTLSFVVWYVFLPPHVTSVVFEKQTLTIQAINNQVSGNAVEQFPVLTSIFLNNMRVLAFAVLFAFIYGAGAIFILTWNASVIAAAIGNAIRSNLAQYASYFDVVSVSFMRYALHGAPEILAYFYGGLAGGIISVAIIRKHYQAKKFRHILFDVSELLLIAVGFLIIAAFLEVFVTPLLF
jgi:uncharacterized membrane protein SpoIIM required for sporulation